MKKGDERVSEKEKLVELYHLSCKSVTLSIVTSPLSILVTCGIAL